jgi:hypothetical protein
MLNSYGKFISRFDDQTLKNKYEIHIWMKMLNLIKTIEIYQNFEMDEIHVTLIKLNMNLIGP